MVTAADLLKDKGSQVWSISPTDTILFALNIMKEKGVGALLVMDRDQIVGILSERDFARQTAEHGGVNVKAPVSDFMTRDVQTVTPETTIEQCMAWMTKGHFRHFPVVKDGRLAGLISIGDVVKSLIHEKMEQLNSMEELVTGRGYVTHVR